MIYDDLYEYRTCDDEGHSGNCGFDCSVFIRGDCDNHDVPMEQIFDFSRDDVVLNVWKYVHDYDYNYIK